MKLSKRGQASIKGKTLAIIVGVLTVVILVTMAPSLWTSMSTALDSLAGSTIPFASLFNSTSGIVGLVFGAVILLGSIGALFVMLGNKR